MRWPWLMRAPGMHKQVPRPPLHQLAGAGEQTVQEGVDEGAPLCTLRWSLPTRHRARPHQQQQQTWPPMASGPKGAGAAVGEGAGCQHMQQQPLQPVRPLNLMHTCLAAAAPSAGAQHLRAAAGARAGAHWAEAPRSSQQVQARAPAARSPPKPLRGNGRAAEGPCVVGSRHEAAASTGAGGAGSSWRATSLLGAQ